MNFIKKNFSLIVSTTFILSFPFKIFAQFNPPCNPAGGSICNPISATSFTTLIKDILEGAITIGIPIIALAIIYCGFLFVQARGNPEEIKKAKNSLIYTLIGATILLGAWAIAQLISETVLAL